MKERKPNRPEPTVLADSFLGYNGFMPEDPNSPLASDTNPSSNSEFPNRPEPIIETPVSASESANTQQESAPSQDQSSVPVVLEQPPASSTESPKAPPAPDPVQSQETPSVEPVSISNSTQTEPSGTTPPAQAMPPETEPIKEESQDIQAATEPQSKPEPEAPQPQNQEVTPPPAVEPSPVPSTPPTPPIPSLHYPFYGSYPVTFDFGAQPTDEKIKKKYQEWGIIGHNGIDFGLQEGTEVLACDDGVVILAGDNGDHGISVTIKHSWGTSTYSHLQSLGVLVHDHLAKARVIGASGQTGFTTGPHLHFGIQPNSPDTNNGYLGFINPAPYLTETSPLPQFPQSPISPQSPESPDLSPELSVEKPVEEPPKQELPVVPPKTQIPITPVHSSTNQDEMQKQVDLSAEVLTKAEAMFDARIKENSIKGNQTKKAKRDEAIQKIFTFAQEKKRITNEQIRDLLHVSQSTATDYLSDLVNRGMLKVEGKGKATVYIF